MGNECLTELSCVVFYEDPPGSCGFSERSLIGEPCEIRPEELAQQRIVTSIEASMKPGRSSVKFDLIGSIRCCGALEGCIWARLGVQSLSREAPGL